MLAFLFRYYNIYFYVFPMLIFAYAMLYFRGKKKKIIMQKKALIIPLVSMTCVLMAYAYKYVSGMISGSGLLFLLIKVLCLVTSGCILALVIYVLTDAEAHTIDLFIKKNSWGFLIFIVLFLEFLFNKSENLKPWGSCWYGVDYSMGIGSRFFIGSLLQLITGGNVSTGIAYFFCELTLVLIIIMLAILSNAVIKKAEDEEVKAVIFLIACFLCSPGSIAGMWTDGNMGRMETYTLALAVVSIFVFKKVGNVVWRYTGIIILAVISIAIYQGYVFLYFPIICVLIICDILKDEHIQKVKILSGMISCAVTGFTFLAFQFLSYTNFDDAGQMAEAIRQRTDLNVKEEAIYYEFFASISEAYNNLNKDFLTGTEYPREKTLLLAVLMLPIIVMMIALYGKSIAEAKKKYGKAAIFKTPYAYCILVNLAVLPQFLLNVDWGRWMIAITFNLFFQVLYLYYSDFPEMKQSVRCLNAFIERNQAAAVMCIIYLTIFDKFEDRFYFEQIERVWFFK